MYSSRCSIVAALVGRRYWTSVFVVLASVGRPAFLVLQLHKLDICDFGVVVDLCSAFTGV